MCNHESVTVMLQTTINLSNVNNLKRLRGIPSCRDDYDIIADIDDWLNEVDQKNRISNQNGKLEVH